MKTILLPSGEQAGNMSTSGPDVSRVAPLPSLFTIQRSGLEPPALPPKAILLPSGEKSGKVTLPPRLVTCSCCVPFCFIFQISLTPLRVLQKAISFPAGENEGPASKLASVVRRRRSLPFGRTLYISALPPTIIPKASLPSFVPG